MTEPLPPEATTPTTPEPVAPEPPPLPARTRFAEPAVPAAPAVMPSLPPVAPMPAIPPVPPASLDKPDLAAVSSAPVAPPVPPVPPVTPVALTKPASLPAPVFAQAQARPDLPDAPESLPGTAEAPVPARTSGALMPVLAAVVLVLAGLTGFLGWKAAATAGAGAAQDARPDALQAARNAATLVFSYDYRQLDKDFKAGRATTTGEFQKEYDKTTAKLVSDVAAKYKAVVLAAVSDAAVVQASEDRVLTLVFVNQQSTSTLASAPKVTQSRLEMTMVRRGGHWLVSTIKAL
jgi:Mce-associated membrane protein